VRNPGGVVEKDELLAAVWGGRIIEVGNLSQAIYLLRRALACGEAAEGYIVTAPGRGYGSQPTCSGPLSVRPLVI
jgi:DNA-binding winged helix-turn-helix (wHTH) protein